MRALIVDDVQVNRRVIGHFIAEYGHSDDAVDGNEALSLFRKAIEEQKPYDVVFLDIMMPDLDGQEVLSAIRDYEQEQGVDPDKGAKVIMTTALDDEENLLNAHISGCAAYLVKPISKQKLIEELVKMELISEVKD